MTDPIEPFAAAARAFCQWAESSPGDELSEALAARRLVADVYRLGLDLRGQGFDRGDVPDPVNTEEWHTLFRRFGALPINYYSIADPLVVPSEGSTIGDLADDLADIWSDLTVGLVLYDSGAREQAEHEWRWRFRAHWGDHAANALYALQSWIHKNGPL
jgi:hypothetical protein